MSKIDIANYLFDSPETFTKYRPKTKTGRATKVVFYLPVMLLIIMSVPVILIPFGLCALINLVINYVIED